MMQDPATDVATLIHILGVIELLHERVEAVACFRGAVVIVGRGGREPESWNRRCDDMESWNGRVWRIRQEVDDLRDLQERTRSTMNEQQRDRIISFGSMVHEVERDVMSIVRIWGLNSRGGLFQFGVDGGLFGEPVVVVESVVTERGEVGNGWTFRVG